MNNLYFLKHAFLLFCACFLMVGGSIAQSWTQRGNSIGVTGTERHVGMGVAMNSDGTLFAVSSPEHSSGQLDGSVRVWQWSAGNWTQKGNTIYSFSTPSSFGRVISLSADGQTLAVSGHTIFGADSTQGRVRVFRWNGADWLQLGGNLDGAINEYFGSSLALSADGNRLCIGAAFASQDGLYSGSVRTYQWNGNVWQQMGASISGDIYAAAGMSVSLSSNGSIVAVGAPFDQENGNSAGKVRVYAWNGSAWVQQGSDLTGGAWGDFFGYAVSLSADGKVLCTGAPSQDASGDASGQVKVFEFSAGQWLQRGSDINGDRALDQLGYSVSLSADGNRLVAGAQGDMAAFDSVAYVRVMEWAGGSWSEVGNTVFSQAQDLGFGEKVCISGDGSSIGTGARFSNTFAPEGGLARAYELSHTGVEMNAHNPLILYPNPCDGNFSARLPQQEPFVELSVFHSSGKLVLRRQYQHQQHVTVNAGLLPGIYIVELRTSALLRGILIVQ